MSHNENYILNKDKTLGRVGNAVVYLGVRIEDGYQCALKCSRLPMRKEIKTMKELNHKNIIKFHESLSNFNGFTHVIVMEYCNHGSLYEFSELHQGLCDNMFMRVLECLYQGIYYLRGKKILHRDIKPGNMLVHRDNMGYFDVKLGDLGTAKEVDDKNTFNTLVGTEEYLHPDMYFEFLDNVEGSFRANVDLWSTGVTLYHSVVTELPFLPYKYKRTLGCQKVLKTMYQNKKPGIISARQNSSNIDDITWSDSLPSSCRLSPMLRDMASRLIGNLMDLSPNCTFERFFDDADRLLMKKRILVFNSCNGELRLLYLDDLTYDSVVDEIVNFVGFPKQELIIMTRNKILQKPPTSDVECLRSLPIKGHLRYKLTDDTVLVIAQNGEMSQFVTKVLPEVTITAPSQNITTLRDSRKYADNLLRLIYHVSYGANYIDCQINCYFATMFSFNEYVMVDHVRLMKEALPWQVRTINDTCSMTESLINIAEEAFKNIEKYTKMYNSLTTCKKEGEELKRKAKSGETNVEKIHVKIVERREMFKFTDKNLSSENDAMSSDSLDFLVHLAQEVVNEMKMLPDDKLKGEEAYKLEVWQRQIRLFDYYNVSKKRFQAKSERIQEIHKDYCHLLKTGLGGMNTIRSWKKHIEDQAGKCVNVKNRFFEIIEWSKKIPYFPSANTPDSVGEMESNAQPSGDKDTKK